MEVILETTSNLERKMRISVPSKEVELQVDAKLKQAAGQVKINGFRPGKVPMREVKRRFGDGIRQEVSSELMQSSFSEALQKEDVSPAGQPQIEDIKMEAGKDLEFTAVFEVFPDVELGDFTKINVEKPIASVEDDDLESMIQKLQDQRMDFAETGRASKTDDKINIDFEGFVDNEAFDGGKGEASDIIIGSGSMIPGFEDGLVDCKAGEEKDLELKFPDEYQAENLAGKDVIFKIKVNTVSEPKKPELDDDFFKLFGVEEGGEDAFRVEVRGNMEKELEAAVKNKVKIQVMDSLVEITELEIPKALISSEIDRMRQEAVQQFGGSDKIDPSVLPAEMFEKQAEKRVKLGLIVNAIVEQLEVKVDDDKVKETIEGMASSYEEPEQVVNYYYNNEQQLNQIQNMVLEEQVVETILEESNVSEINMSYDDAIKPAVEAIPETMPEASGDAEEESSEDDDQEKTS
jgi:trigger factor